MHYRRVRRHGSPEYRWGGKVVGRACALCDRPATSKDLCNRHYQMLRRHGDPMYADKKKVGGFPNGTHKRRGYKMVCPVSSTPSATPATDPSIEKSDRSHLVTRISFGFRDGSKRSRREWEHRKVTGAKPGEIVHHIDLNPANNKLDNLHVFDSPAGHSRAHRSLERLVKHMLTLGLAVFDRQSGVYKPAKFFPQSI